MDLYTVEYSTQAIPKKILVGFLSITLLMLNVFDKEPYN